MKKVQVIRMRANKTHSIQVAQIDGQLNANAIKLIAWAIMQDLDSRRSNTLRMHAAGITTNAQKTRQIL